MKRGGILDEETGAILSLPPEAWEFKFENHNQASYSPFHDWGCVSAGKSGSDEKLLISFRDHLKSSRAQPTLEKDFI